MIRKLAAVFALLLLSLSVFAGAPLTTAQAENLNATKRSFIDSSGVNISVSSYKIINATAGVAWVHFYDLPCASVTQGTTVPTWVEVLPSNSQVFTGFPAQVTTVAELCVTSVTGYKGTTGSANGVGMQIFTQ